MKIILSSLLFVLFACLVHFNYAQILLEDEAETMAGLDSEGADEFRLREDTIASLIGN
uniref:Venom peptide Pp15a n=1 Tax=Pristhesancus plagipennis TaxID=1955184 RepID=A0A2K8JNU3_PRIPG|nr:venom peptide Pp15a [Pristhesancus plagipennis]